MRTALPQWKRDEIAVAYALLTGTELIHEPACIGYLAVEPRDIPPGHSGIPPCWIGNWVHKGDAARAFLRRRGFFQCAYTGDIFPTSGGNLGR